MPKRKKKGSRRSKKIPLAAAAGVGMAFAEPIQIGLQGNIMEALYSFGAGLTGYRPDQGWNPASMAKGALPIFVGALVSVAASKLGVNRRLQAIPLFKV